MCCAVQERLTTDIAGALMDFLQPSGVAVVIEAKCVSMLHASQLQHWRVSFDRHMCMVMRGVQKTQASTVTSTMLGVFRHDPKTREEFLQFVKK